MKPIQPLTPLDRDRALNRLRRLTMGAGIGSLVAVGGLSVVASASYSGKLSAAAVPVAASPAASSAGATAGQAATPAAPTVQATAVPTAAATAAPVVTSGGS